ncbi:GxxExxY protein [Stieleria mannarensis]|uniref:GxxExxY protein n=1 Tax=Stieleria mannarensis TaxID=2755585 RepID=UPI001C729867|nr:GxxExxY protein [Rhodopirellula sp. JC639]
MFSGAAIFEWKSVDALCDMHRAQLLNYLMLCEVRAGKLVNLRPETIEQEFVNVALTRAQRQSFGLDSDNYSPSSSSDHAWMQGMIAALRDWGTGLDQGLYLALSDFLYGGLDQSHSIATVTSGNKDYGQQNIRTNLTGDVIMISTLNQHLEEFQRHCQLFLNHLDRNRLHWLNIGLHKVTFETLHKAA